MLIGPAVARPDVSRDSSRLQRTDRRRGVPWIDFAGPGG
jgi:hypothetical protein